MLITLPFVVADLILLAILVLFPEIVLWLPGVVPH
jgi:TRAP-type C4-dicarboxylate transport system permease large subunit